MVLDLVIIGLAITLEPVTLVAFILILGAEQGVWKGLAFILGWMACLVAVIAAAVLVTGGKPLVPHTAPSAGALVVKAVHSGRLADADLVLPAGYVEFPGHGVVHCVRADGGRGSL